MSRTGRICPVRLVMWRDLDDPGLRRDRALRKASTTAAGEGGGTGKLTCLTTIPSRRARCSQVVSMRG